MVVVDPRPIVRAALVGALAISDAGFVVRELADTSARALSSLGKVDVVVASDVRWARGKKFVDAEPFDVVDSTALSAAVLAVAQGSPAFVPAVTRSGAGAARRLTERESAVLDAFARGLTAAGVASELRISASAVAGAKRRMLSKLEVTTVVEALRSTGRAGPPDSRGRLTS
ncbi:hypothetical protein GRQ65_10315 [Nocardioides sp. YIM 123512]|uniref:HTH luxR-type domain-containing protein n=1 Tax=Nocardioides flavescens TaxID=2691959 RepID=A0A6L7EW08_9ACTN|nr:hypothetical protein [Nocardioides flavescens]